MLLSATFTCPPSLEINYKSNYQKIFEQVYMILFVVYK